MFTETCVQRWIAEARGGSCTALDRLLAACTPYLLALANQELDTILRSRLDPEDLVQDTLLKAWRNFPHFRGESEAEMFSWLRQILRNNQANERREHVSTTMRSIRREVLKAEAMAMTWPDDADRELLSSEKHAQTRERQEALEGALRRLPAHYRQALDLHTKEDWTFAQIGEQLGCSAEAARKIWRRAATKLARSLADL